MKKVYRRTRIIRFGELFVCGAGLLVIATVILIAIPTRLSEVQIGQIVVVPIASYIFVIIAASGKHALNHRLELNDRGITSVCWGTVYSTWENLSEFGYARFGKSTFIGIVTRQPTSFTQDWYERLGASHFDFTHFVPIGHVVFLKQKYLLRAGYDWDAFAQTPLGQDLMHYAPHLFEKEFIDVDAKRQSQT